METPAVVTDSCFTEGGSNTVVVRLTGGLGNQLFQYATGRNLALARQSRLVLDIRPLERCSLRSYGLQNFCIQASVGKPTELPPARHQKLRYLLWKYSPSARRRLVNEPKHVQPQVLQTASSYPILHGYWQSEEYFRDHAETIRRELTVKPEPEGLNLETLKHIQETFAVSVHIRRGDYVASAKNQSVFASCEPGYYESAAHRIIDSSSREHPHFFVFSDDPDWVSESIRLPGPMTLVRHNDGETAHEDLRLMSACRHHIIANSTFSWWGAWLHSGGDQLVVAPKRWFCDEATQDPVPTSWIRLSNDGLEDSRVSNAA